MKETYSTAVKVFIFDPSAECVSPVLHGVALDELYSDRVSESAL